MDLEGLIERCRSVARVALVTGQITDKHRERVGVLDVGALAPLALKGARTRVVADEWLTQPDLDALAHALGAGGVPARVGAWDALHSTRWRYAWLDGFVWDPRGVRAQVVAPRTLALRGVRPADGPALLEVARVRATLSPSWLVRTVLVVDRRNREHVVARKRELSVVLDPTYDGIDLMFDAAWCEQMARSLASGLAVDLDVDAALK